MSDESPSSSGQAGQLTQLRTLLRNLLDEGAEFVVIGGRAEQLMGGSRNTDDSDFCYRRDRENLKRIVAALAALKPRPRDFPADLPFTFDTRTLEFGTAFTFETTVGKVDLLGEVEPIGGYEEVVANSETYEVDGRPVRTISLADLIRVKEHIRRSKDQASLDQLYILREERRAENSDRS